MSSANKASSSWTMIGKITLLGVAAILFHHYGLPLFRQPTDPASGDDMDDDDDSFPWQEQEEDNVDDKVVPFPWEPKPTREPSNKKKGAKYAFRDPTTKSGIYPAGQKQHQNQQFDQQQQLDFLSSMTFANGGLRAPNCPCCV
jgi:hypothetical protein